MIVLPVNQTTNRDVLELWIKYYTINNITFVIYTKDIQLDCDNVTGDEFVLTNPENTVITESQFSNIDSVNNEIVLYKHIPNDFNAAEYKALHKDLQHFSDAQAKRHYEFFGFNEQRKYKLYEMDYDFYRRIYPFAEQFTNEQIGLDCVKYGRFRNGDELKKKSLENESLNAVVFEKLLAEEHRIGDNRFHILMRTTEGRKSYVMNAIHKIRSQTHKNYHIYLSYDSESCLPYLKELQASDLTLVSCIDISDANESKYKFNLYMNRLMDLVTNDYIIFHDDDNQFVSDKVLELLNNRISDNAVMYIFSFLRPDGFIYPKVPNECSYGSIDTACFIFHARHCKAARWDDKQGADYRFYSDLIKSVEFQFVKTECALQRTQFHDRIASFGKRFTWKTFCDNNNIKQTICINLPRRADRKETMMERFNELKMNVTFYAAIDGQLPEIKEKWETYKSESEKLPNGNFIINSAGAMGLLETAKQLYSKLYETMNDDEKVCIFEDDTIFHKDFMLLLGERYETIPDNSDVFFLGSNQTCWSDITFNTNHTYAPSAKHPFYGTYGMIVTKRALCYINEKLISSHKYSLDLLWWNVINEHKLTCSVCYPNLILPDVRNSDNMGDRDIKEMAGLRKWDLEMYLTSNAFCFIVPVFNFEKYIIKCLTSVVNQTYNKWRIILINDAATDNSMTLVNNFIKEHNLTSKITIINNVSNMKQAYSRYIAYQQTENTEICVMLDGDDWLYENTTIEKVNRFYNENHVDMTYGQFQYFKDNRIGNKSGIGKYSCECIKNRSYREENVFCAQHLRTMRSSLIKSIPKEQLMYNGEWLQCCTDYAEMMYCLERSIKHMNIGFPCLYYNVDSSISFANSYYNRNNDEEWLQYRNNVMKHIKSHKLPTFLENTKIVHKQFGKYDKLYNYSLMIEHEIKSPINSVVDKVYCINLIDNDKKLETFIKIVNEYNIDCEIMRVTKLKDSATFMNVFNDVKTRSQGNKLWHQVPGELGCTISHLMCLKDAIENNYNNIIIFEDDILPMLDLNKKFEEYKELILSKAFVYLGASQWSWPDSLEYKTMSYNAWRTCGSFALYINKEVFTPLFDEYSKLERKLDNIPWELYNKCPKGNDERYFSINRNSPYYDKCIVLYPNLFIADVSESDIRDKQDNKTRCAQMKWDMQLYHTPLHISNVVKTE
jgi:GR25 family glycosyltransferase involved in LPS biosynthesis